MTRATGQPWFRGVSHEYIRKAYPMDGFVSRNVPWYEYDGDTMGNYMERAMGDHGLYH